MVGVAKQVSHDCVLVTPGEIQIEFLVCLQCVLRVARRNVCHHDNL